MGAVLRGLAHTKVMAPPALRPDTGESVPAVRLAMAYLPAEDRIGWVLDILAVTAAGDFRQHTVRDNGRPLTAAAIGEGLIELGNLVKAAG